MSCEHASCSAHVDLILDGDKGTANVRIQCDECGLPFVFESIAGDSEVEPAWRVPYVSNGATMLHLPISPARLDRVPESNTMRDLAEL